MNQKHNIEPLIESLFPSESVQVSPLYGGSINQVFKVQAQKTYCIKINSGVDAKSMFDKEVLGLKALSATDTFKTPYPFQTGTYDAQHYLLMSYIEPGEAHTDFVSYFAQNLAKLHQESQAFFGLDHDNFIGPLHQRNTIRESWPLFYAENRLKPLFIEAYDQRIFNKRDLEAFEHLCSELKSIFPEEKPSLLHGDLWSGNYLVDVSGNPVLIDPAVYYGHREMDLGMMKLFGGFHDEIFDLYNQFLPLEEHWEKRIPIAQLYPLLVHVKLFGGGYVGQVKRIIDTFR